jgi:hypothetical protein
MLVNIVNRCLCKAPEDRYPNIARFALDLYRVAPRRVRVSARRIVGVFRRAGVDAADSPPPSGDTAELLAELTPFPPKRVTDSAPRASRGAAYDSDTHVMPDRAPTAPMLESEEPQRLNSTLNSTLVMAEPPPEALSDSGRFPAVPRGKAGESGRYPAVLPDQTGASGEYPAPFGDLSAYERSSDRHRRAVTAQSWQHMLGEPPGRSGGRRMAVLVATAAAVCAVVAVVAIVNTGTSESAPGSVAPVPNAPTVGAPAAEPDPDPEPPRVAPAPKQSASSAKSTGRAPRPTASSRRPRPMTPRPHPPVVKSAPEPKPTIFDER